MILKSFCDGEVCVRLSLSINYDEKEIRLEVTTDDISAGRGSGISFDASEFEDALIYYDSCVASA